MRVEDDSAKPHEHPESTVGGGRTAQAQHDRACPGFDCVGNELAGAHARGSPCAGRIDGTSLPLQQCQAARFGHFDDRLLTPQCPPGSHGAAQRPGDRRLVK